MTRFVPPRLVALLLTVLPAMTARAGTTGRATCRNGNTDRPESGLQGQTTQAEIDAGLDKVGFNCNIDLVGQYQGEGASWQLTAWKNCAYFDQRRVTSGTQLKNPGVIVLDVSNPGQPRMTKNLPEPSMLDPWESLKVNPTRQMLAGDQQGGQGIAIYDISKDCTNPQLLSSVNLPGSIGHTGQWAPDGKTYYITPLRPTPSIVVVDTSDATNPQIIPCAQGSLGCNSSGFFVAPATNAATGAPLSSTFHDLEFSKDGNLAYVAMTSAAANGLLILDISDFQSRKASPGFRVVGSLNWDDGSRGAQNALPITVKGKPYILFSDEGGGGAGSTGCAAGKSPYGFARLIDISDPANPKTSGKLMLDINDPKLCTQILASPNTTNGGNIFGYSSHYCNVDDADNATLAACSYFSAGWRFFDIRDPANPREVAYYKPPSRSTQTLLGSQYWSFSGASNGFVRHFDWATSKASFPKDRGVSSGDIWITSQDNGFMVVRLNEGGGGCTSAEGSLGGLVALAIGHLVRRRKGSRSQPQKG